MSHEPIFISFATACTEYEKIIERLVDSFDKFNLEHHTELVEHRGSWQANSAYRSTWIREQLENFERPVVWVDADAVVRQFPEDFWKTGYDLMAFFHPNGRIAGGTTYWAPSETCYNLLREWERRVSIPFDQWPEEHQRLTEMHLLDAFNCTQGLRVNRLSVAYCKIFDREPDVQPVIEHFQATRTLLEKIGDARARAPGN